MLYKGCPVNNMGDITILGLIFMMSHVCNWYNVEHVFYRKIMYGDKHDIINTFILCFFLQIFPLWVALKI